MSPMVAEPAEQSAPSLCTALESCSKSGPWSIGCEPNILPCPWLLRRAAAGNEPGAAATWLPKSQIAFTTGTPTRRRIRDGMNAVTI